PSSSILSVRMEDPSVSCRLSRSLSPSPLHSSLPSPSLPIILSPLLTRTSSERDKDGRILRHSISVSPQLTPSQVVLIRKSWKHVNTKGLIGVLRRCFQRLESACPSVASSFSLASNSLSTSPTQIRTLADHAKYLAILMQRVIDSEEGVDEELKSVGASHVRLQADQGIGIKEFERFGEIFVEVILKLDGIQQSKETSRAWRQLICSMVDHFRDGFDSHMRQTRRKSSFGVHSEYFDGLEYRRNSSPGSSSRKTSLGVPSNPDQLHPRKLSDYS
ncbi:hypothetical protein PFISCL1PPCAC_5778, partial [Pristionchus fissidentatus]